MEAGKYSILLLYTMAPEEHVLPLQIVSTKTLEVIQTMVVDVLVLAGEDRLADLALVSASEVDEE